MKKSIGPQTIVFPTPVFIIGTYDTEGKADAMNAAWGGIAASEPPTIAISVRHARQTWQNIQDNQSFTINIPACQHMAEADYFGIVSGKDADKFAVTGLTAVKASRVNAPIIQEFPLNLECRVSHIIEVGSHMHILGEILDVVVSEEFTDDKGQPDITKINPLSFDMAHSVYHEAGAVVGKAFSVGLALRK
jgi:flavin reductase (DIM6/NTAB) family NADH-FMN oxidoreductase RutF